MEQKWLGYLFRSSNFTGEMFSDGAKELVMRHLYCLCRLHAYTWNVIAVDVYNHMQQMYPSTYHWHLSLRVCSFPCFEHKSEVDPEECWDDPHSSQVTWHINRPIARLQVVSGTHSSELQEDATRDGGWGGRVKKCQPGSQDISHDGSMVLLYMVTWIPSIYLQC